VSSVVLQAQRYFLGLDAYLTIRHLSLQELHIRLLLEFHEARRSIERNCLVCPQQMTIEIGRHLYVIAGRLSHRNCG